MARKAYADQVQLLVELLPLVGSEADFALKGGTAINLFHRDLPRLSVDIDLTFLPVRDRATSLAAINAALERIAAQAGRMPSVQAHRIAGGGGEPTRLQLRRGGVAVKIETSPVLRGVVFDPEQRAVTPAVEDEFGFAEVPVVAFADLYAGKLVAALDRQHPRDLFDVLLLYENEGLTDDLFRAFLVYLASAGRPTHELLDPNPRPLARTFEREFAGMTRRPVALSDLERVRTRLVADLRAQLSGPAATFLASLADLVPDFDAIGVPHAAELPAIRWKLANLARLAERDPGKLKVQGDALKALLS